MARFRIVGVFVCALGLIGAFERSARAYCFVENNARTCYVPDARGGVIGVVGRNANGHWIGWRDAFSNDCLGWDQIGDANGFDYTYTTVSGTSYTDYLGTVPYADYVFCDKTLNAPVSPGSVLTLDGWAGGYDNLVSYVTFQVSLTCDNRLDGESCFMQLGGPGNIYGSPGSDYVEKHGQGAWNFDTGDGDDIIYNYTSVSPSNAFCGEGEDYFNGTLSVTGDSCNTIE